MNWSQDIVIKKTWLKTVMPALKWVLPLVISFAAVLWAKGQEVNEAVEQVQRNTTRIDSLERRTRRLEQKMFTLCLGAAQRPLVTCQEEYLFND